MPCFKPLKTYLAHLTRSLIKKYSISGPFLDVGCGDGTFTELLLKEGLWGKAIDISDECVEMTLRRVAGYDCISVEKKDLFSIEEDSKYSCILMYDVLEHMKNPILAKEKIGKLLENKGYVMASFPIKIAEWRWDDENYGHYRRYELEDVKKMFNQDGFELKIIWDITFPVFWGMRRIYTKFREPYVRNSLDFEEKARKSAFESAAGNGFLFRLMETLPIWNMVFRLQDLFIEKTYGCNVLILSIKQN